MKEPTIQELLAADVTGNAATINPDFAPEVKETKRANELRSSTTEPDAVQPQQDVYSINKELAPEPVMKGKKFTLELNPFEYDQARRAAAAVNEDVKDWLMAQLTAKLTTNIGRSKIFGPTGASTNKVTGPSVGVSWE